jgi:hypothetical protein
MPRVEVLLSKPDLEKREERGDGHVMRFGLGSLGGKGQGMVRGEVEK